MRIFEYLLGPSRIGRLVRDRHRGAVRGIGAARVPHIVDEEGPAAIVAEYGVARAGIPVGVSVAVRLPDVREQVAGLVEELEIDDIRRASIHRSSIAGMVEIPNASAPPPAPLP